MTRAMKPYTLAAAIFAVAVLAGCGTTPRQQFTPGAALIVTKPVYDFAYAGPKLSVQHTFEFYNAGDVPISITGLAVCCGCEAQPSVEPGIPILPGQSGGVLVTCALPSYEGAVEKVITLHTDVQDGEEILLVLKGEVSRRIVLQPSSIYFGKLKKGEASVKKLRVHQMSSKRLHIRKIEADPDFYSVDVVRFDETNHRGFDVNVKFLGNVAVGIHRDIITIHTDDQRQAKIDVPIVAQVTE